jgi:hypothetical protein
MRKIMQDGDEIVDRPPRGQGAGLRIRYVLPRSTGLIDQGEAAPELEDKPIAASQENKMNWKKFEDHARRHMERFFSTTFSQRRPQASPKRFDFVSPDEQTIGDAKFLTLVHRVNLPPAKFMEIAGHVWLLEHTSAKRKFLVFGNQRKVAEWWLDKYGSLGTDVEFYFLDEQGNITNLKEGANKFLQRTAKSRR